VLRIYPRKDFWPSFNKRCGFGTERDNIKTALKTVGKTAYSELTLEEVRKAANAYDCTDGPSYFLRHFLLSNPKKFKEHFDELRSFVTPKVKEEMQTDAGFPWFFTEYEEIGDAGAEILQMLDEQERA